MSSFTTDRRDQLGELRLNGYRRTPPRTEVIRALQDLGTGTPEEIAEYAQSHVPGINLSTVYRTLDLLDRLGVVHAVSVERGPTRYHLRHGRNHLHLVCRCCGQVSAVQADTLAASITLLAAARGFTVDSSLFLVPGQCHDCATAGEEP